MTTCTHPDAAARPADCGQPQEWYCETWGGCEQSFTRIKPHRVMKFRQHEDTCTRTPRLPVGWCCPDGPTVSGCVDCNQEFPPDAVADLPVGEWTEIPA